MELCQVVTSMPAQQVVKHRDVTQSHIGSESVRVQAADAEPAGTIFALPKNSVTCSAVICMPLIWAVQSVCPLQSTAKHDPM